MILMFLLVFCAVITGDAKEGDYCIKEGAVGLCTNIRACPDAQQDIQNKKRPQICEFLVDPIVCCVSAVVISIETTEKPPKKCVLPQYPEHGTYVPNVANGKPGEAYYSFTINVSCGKGYDLKGSKAISCQDGVWSEQIPECTHQCLLVPHPSVEYNCLISEGGVTGTRPCKEYEPHETIVKPRCRTPDYYTVVPLKFMHCVEGIWDYVAKCTPECGTLSPGATEPVLGGEPDTRVKAPWHASIFVKSRQQSFLLYIQLCGGSLISSTIIITAAHCFWNNYAGRQPDSDFAVAVGKLYRSWIDHEKTEKSQRLDVKEIHLPSRFQGDTANYQDDIAVVIVKGEFQFNAHVRPVCVDFNVMLERRQLEHGKKGKLAGWGLTADSSKGLHELRVIDMSYISIQNCIKNSPAAYRKFITGDKICAGLENDGMGLCKVDNGGGLAFSDLGESVSRYYLRGVLSIVPQGDKSCSEYTNASFSQVMKHEHFIERFL